MPGRLAVEVAGLFRDLTSRKRRILVYVTAAMTSGPRATRRKPIYI
jgi:hypothetical protein